MFKGCYNVRWVRAPPGKGRAQLSSLSAGGGAIGGGGACHMSNIKNLCPLSLMVPCPLSSLKCSHITCRF